MMQDDSVSGYSIFIPVSFSIINSSMSLCYGYGYGCVDNEQDSIEKMDSYQTVVPPNH